MKKVILIILVLISVTSAQKIKFRVSESKDKQNNLQFLQNGILLRFGHQYIQKDSILFWRAKEFWIPRDIKSENVRIAIKNKFPGINPVLLDGIINYYNQKVTVDTVIINKYNQIINLYKTINFEDESQKERFNRKLVRWLKR